MNAIIKHRPADGNLLKNGEKKLYFVLETKGSERLADLRDVERLKINCGKKRFEALGSGVEMQVATEWDTVRKKI